MSGWVFCQGGTSGLPATNVFHPICGAYVNDGYTEADVQWLARGSYTVSKVRVSVYLTSGTYTLVSRKNGANGSISISSITSTGIYEDTTNSDSLSSGDLYCFSWNRGSHSDDAYLDTIQSQVTSAADGALVYCAGSDANIGNNAPDNWVMGVSGAFICTESSYQAVVESDRSVDFRSSVTLSNLRVWASIAGTVTNTITVRKNGSDTSLAVSFASGETGAKEDTTDSVSFASGDEFSGRLNGNISGLFVTTASLKVSNDLSAIGRNEPAIDSNRFAGNAWQQFALGGGIFAENGGGFALDDDAVVAKCPASTVTYLTVKVLYNTVNASVPIAIRKNASNTSLSVSVSASSTGEFANTSETVSVSADDELSFYKSEATGSTGAIDFSSIQVLMGDAPAAQAAYTPAVGALLWTGRGVGLNYTINMPAE